MTINLGQNNDYDDECMSFKIKGFFMFILFVSSTISNSICIWIFYKSKSFKPCNFFMITLLALNLTATFVDGPYTIYKGYNCNYA